WEAVQAELNSGVGQAAFAKLSKEFSELDPLITVIHKLRAAQQEQRDLQDLARDASADREMKAMAAEELEELKPRISALEHELKLLLLPKDEADERSAILEIRAGTG